MPVRKRSSQSPVAIKTGLLFWVASQYINHFFLPPFCCSSSNRFSSAFCFVIFSALFLRTNAAIINDATTIMTTISSHPTILPSSRFLTNNAISYDKFTVPSTRHYFAPQTGQGPFAKIGLLFGHESQSMAIP